MNAFSRYAWAVARIMLGWIFLWAFADEFFGLGKPTPHDSGVLHGGSPSRGFLQHAHGPFGGLFHAMAGAAWADASFMFGLAGLGVALILGVCLRIAAIGGVVLLAFLWAASLWPASNPFMDQHWIYAGLLVALAATNAGDTLGLGRTWHRVPLVRKAPILR